MKKGTTAIISSLIGTILGAAGMGYLQGKQINQKSEKVDKFKGYYNMLNQWLILKQEGKSLEEYFIKNEYKKIAIYGMGEMGSRLYDELKNTNIEIKYAIDKNASSTYSELSVFELDDMLEEVDAIIVSAIFAYNEIEKELSNKTNYPIISLEDVVYEI